MHLFPRILDLMREKKLEDTIVFGGGIIPDHDISELKKIGVAEIFPPGSSLEEIVTFVREHVRRT